MRFNDPMVKNKYVHDAIVIYLIKPNVLDKA